MNAMNDNSCIVALLLLAIVCFFPQTSVAWWGNSEEVLVTLKHGGQVKGTVQKSNAGRNIYSFRGIPFAEAPVNDLRFKAPVPKSPWTGILDATKDGASCIQLEPLMKFYQGEEDCLFINVFTPFLPDESDVDEDDHLAVMVWFYGGAFMSGSSNSAIYNGGKLVDKNVILVTMNYRVGPIGFLSTGDEASPGNYGLLDQTLSLKWVREHISAFGGDPNRVTIFGESAGGASAGFHLFSPLSSGLFHRAIAQSGSPICAWAIQEEPLRWSQKLAKDFNCDISTTEKLISCLRKIPAMSIVEKSNTYYDFSYVPTMYKPNVDGYFISEDPVISLKKGNILNKVPYISGICKDEGEFFEALIRRDCSVKSPTKDVSFVKRLIHYSVDRRTDIYEEAPNVIYKKYYSEIDVNDESQTRKATVDMLTDGIMKMCHLETVSQLAKAGVPSYAFSFDYDGTGTLTKALRINDNLGVGHSAEIFLQFSIQLPGFPYENDQDKNVSHIINRLFVNFAKTGNPTPKETKTLPLIWQPSTENKISVFHINHPVQTSVLDLHRDDLYTFWTKDVVQAIEESKRKLKKDEL